MYFLLHYICLQTVVTNYFFILLFIIIFLTPVLSSKPRVWKLDEEEVFLRGLNIYYSIWQLNQFY